MITRCRRFILRQASPGSTTHSVRKAGPETVAAVAARYGPLGMDVSPYAEALGS